MRGHGRKCRFIVMAAMRTASYAFPVMHPRRVGFVGFDGITALDLVGPMEAFGAASADTEHGRRRGYAVLILGLTRQPFRSESGITFRPDTTLDSAPALDTIIVPGGSGLRRQDTARCLAAWLKRRALHTRRIASVCTGIYGLAPSGLLDGRRVTTHWRFAQDVAARFPTLHVEADALFLKDGPFYTSAGITAGIDLALALIEEDYGARGTVGRARAGRVPETAWRSGAVFRTVAVSGSRGRPVRGSDSVDDRTPSPGSVGRRVGRSCRVVAAALQSTVPIDLSHDAGGMRGNPAAPRGLPPAVAGRSPHCQPSGISGLPQR